MLSNPGRPIRRLLPFVFWGLCIALQLLVHHGVPMVTYVTPDGYGLRVAKREAGVWAGELAAGAGLGYIGQSSLWLASPVPYGARHNPASRWLPTVRRATTDTNCADRRPA